MINSNQNIIQPVGIVNNNNISANRTKPSAIAAADDFLVSSMDLSKRSTPKYKGKKDKPPKVGIIETPQYNKTPVKNELLKLEAENPAPKNKKKKSSGLDISGILTLGTICAGGILFISLIRKPMMSVLNKIFHK